jgi:hypothetical protein
MRKVKEAMKRKEMEMAKGGRSRSGEYVLPCIVIVGL